MANYRRYFRNFVRRPRKRNINCSAILSSLVPEQPFACVAEKTANNRCGVIALFEHESARNEAGSPFIFFRPTLGRNLLYLPVRLHKQPHRFSPTRKHQHTSHRVRAWYRARIRSGSGHTHWKRIPADLSYCCQSFSVARHCSTHNVPLPRTKTAHRFCRLDLPYSVPKMILTDFSPPRLWRVPFTSNQRKEQRYVYAST